MRPQKKYKMELLNGGWGIIENPTGLVIDRIEDCRTAKVKTAVLNGGCGFNGATPPFFLNRWALTD